MELHTLTEMQKHVSLPVSKQGNKKCVYYSKRACAKYGSDIPKVVLTTAVFYYLDGQSGLSEP